MNDEYNEVTELLQELGHSDFEIQKIMARLRRYEKEMQLDSIMDSIGQDGFDLDALIQEAIQE
jgi:hypothetical protein